ncbi:MAG: hypothetical protein ACYDC1_11685 [Limisphaerales bacterium]
MAFTILYDNGDDAMANLRSIAIYVDSFAKNLGLKELQIGTQELTSVSAALVRPDFPHTDGLEKASPFKKAAYFFVWFVAQRPILDKLPITTVGEELNGIPNHQNVIFAYHMAVDCLHGAKIHRKDGEVVVLKSKIKVSMHFFRDFVEAFSSAVPAHHFKIVSLLFEQMAYKVNRDASYPEVV